MTNAEITNRARSWRTRIYRSAYAKLPWHEFARGWLPYVALLGAIIFAARCLR